MVFSYVRVILIDQKKSKNEMKKNENRFAMNRHWRGYVPYLSTYQNATIFETFLDFE
jgi:hypothetical protein